MIVRDGGVVSKTVSDYWKELIWIYNKDVGPLICCSMRYSIQPTHDRGREVRSWKEGPQSNSPQSFGGDVQSYTPPNTQSWIDRECTERVILSDGCGIVMIAGHYDISIR